ncbi:MAG TPA: protein kinase, partial [Gaiellaceae bacterium]|nr:protein kinase [Gaiellaceae bacterium]
MSSFSLTKTWKRIALQAARQTVRRAALVAAPGTALFAVAYIMLGADGSAVLTDFGVAKGAASTLLTKPGQVLGTLDYLAPEIVRGEDATSASDLYALGCVAFECLAGAPPFAD